MNLNLITFTFYLVGYNLRHSHIWVAYPQWISHILISPAMHQIHHSAERRHFDKNLGYHLAIWDRLAGTLYIPEGRETFALGIGPEGKRIRGVTASLIQPVIATLAALVPNSQRST